MKKKWIGIFLILLFIVIVASIIIIWLNKDEVINFFGSKKDSYYVCDANINSFDKRYLDKSYNSIRINYSNDKMTKVKIGIKNIYKIEKYEEAKNWAKDEALEYTYNDEEKTIMMLKEVDITTINKTLKEYISYLKDNNYKCVLVK